MRRDVNTNKIKAWLLIRLNLACNGSWLGVTNKIKKPPLVVFAHGKEKRKEVNNSGFFCLVRCVSLSHRDYPELRILPQESSRCALFVSNSVHEAAPD